MKELVLKTLILAFLAGLFLAGCPNKQKELFERKQTLREAVKGYNECFFWRDFDKASRYVLPEKRNDFLAATEELRRGYTLDDYRIMKIKLGPSGEMALVDVKRKYIKAPSVTLQDETISQKWVMKQSAWYLSGPPY
ncbi:MAG: hypothetical protein R6V10_04535 [bacterium]